MTEVKAKKAHETEKAETQNTVKRSKQQKKTEVKFSYCQHAHGRFEILANFAALLSKVNHLLN